MNRHLEKIRKLAFGLLGLGFLAWGLWFTAADLPAPAKDAALEPAIVASVVTANVTLYGQFKDGVWLIVAAIIVGNMGEHLAGAMKKTGPAQPGGTP